MLPAMPVHNMVNGGFGDTEFECQGGASRFPCFAPPPHFPNLNFGELRLRRAFAARASFRGDHGGAVPPLRYHVGGIVLNGSQEEMVRPDAARVIAVVADEEAIGNGPNVEFVGETMGEVAGIMKAHPTVAPMMSVAVPYPAMLAPFDAAPEACVNGVGESVLPALPGAVENATHREARWRNLEDFSASLAEARDSVSGPAKHQ
jgi:hypothetical protein